MPLRLTLLALSAAATAYGFAGGWWLPLLVVGIALWFRITAHFTLRTAFVTGFGWGGVVFLIHIWWIRVVGYDVWLAASLFEALYFGVLAVLLVVLRRLPWWPLWFTAAWVAVETVRHTIPWGGFAWGRPGFAAIDTPLMIALPVVGVAGATWCVVGAAALLAWLSDTPGLASRGRQYALSAGVLALAAPLAAGYAMYSDPEVDGETVRIAVVQGNVPGRGDDILNDYRQVTANHVEETLELARSGPDVDLVIWPENSTAVDPFKTDSLRNQLQSTVDAIDRPVLVGGIVDGPEAGTVLNQGILWTPDGPREERYTKRHPVPFGEYIPIRNLGITKWIERLDLVPRDMLPGGDQEPLQWGDILIGDAICFDVSYDDVARDHVNNGANLLTVQTSNAMFVYTDQLDQQFAMSRIRAAESRRWMGLAAVNGISGIIRPDGSVAKTVPRREQETLVHDVRLNDDITLAMRLGPWPARVGILIALGAVLVGVALQVQDSRNRSKDAARGQ